MSYERSITESPQRVIADDDALAIRVENVSKSFALWSSPSARLKLPILSILRRLSPSSKATQLIERRSAGIYRSFSALQDVSIEIKKGESWGVVGVNGSGKSTLLKMIAGNLRPSAGRIEVNGKVAILDYSSGLHGAFTGRENVYLKAALHGMSRRNIDEKFQSIESFADIGQFIDQPVKTYSSGMVARLGFAIMAHIDADIIITDEALAVGDAFFVQKSMNFLRSFLERGTFLFVSHSTHDVVSLCTKAVWLDHGRIREIGSAKDVTDAYLSSQSLQGSHAYLKKAKIDLPQETDAVQNGAQPTEIDVAQNGSQPASTTTLRQPLLSKLTHASPPRIIKDPRLEFINRSNWRNDVEIPEFLADSPGFGVGGARIEDVTFHDDSGAVLAWIIGAEMVHLKITARAERDLVSPIIGFQVRDRLGQVLFADNTFLLNIDEPLHVSQGSQFMAEFCFQMPLLPVGEYAIRVAIALGTESQNAMMHCIDTALVFRSTTSAARHGLVGVPMHCIQISVILPPAPAADAVPKH